jgi:K+-sensing histidine kinase KdpD
MIEATPDPQRIDHVLMRVTDTGIGIPAEKLGKVFESFSQADQSTARQYGGIGLGFRICQRLVAAQAVQNGQDGGLSGAAPVAITVLLDQAMPQAPTGVENIQNWTMLHLNRACQL